MATKDILGKTFNGKNETDPPPPKLTRAQILRQLAKASSRTPGKHPSHEGVKRKRNPLVEKKWSKQSIFFELPYRSSLELKHNLDVMHIEKNVLENLVCTLLMNDKSKDTNKARQDLEELKIQKELWLIHKGNRKFLKPHPIYSFTPEKRRKFCEFIKGVKLLNRFGSNFKPKVTDNDNNIIGMKSHDCHIMMQRLLAVGAQAYLDPTKPEGSIAEGSVEEEALTFCHLKGVQTRFNRPDRNDGPPPTCEMQVFRECRISMSENDLPTKFSPWFCDKISTLRHEKPSEYSLDLLALAHGLLNYATYYSSCIVNGVKFVVHSRDERLTTQCSGVSTPGEEEDGNMFYGVLEEILELQYAIHDTLSSDLTLTTNLEDSDYRSLSGMALVQRRGHGGDIGTHDDDHEKALKRARDGELEKKIRLGGK
ncbi:hypothetical protein Tco_0845831 [Tanacetum coccineum]